MIYEKKYLVYLLSCSIKNRPAKLPPKEIDWSKLYDVAGEQKILPLVFEQVAKLGNKGPDVELLRKWQQETLSCVYFFKLQNEQLLKILSTAERKGVDILLLKGSVIKDLYPIPELRTMSDYDGLIKNEQLDLVKEVFISEGYNIAKENDETIEFEKEGCLKFEFFYSVFTKIKKDEKFGLDLWENAIPVVGQHIKRPSDENFLVHLLAHLIKHLNTRGAGIRNLADISLFVMKNELDYEYIISQMKLLNSEKIFYGIMKAAEKYFGVELSVDCQDIEPDMVDKLILYMMENGVYGVTENIFLFDARFAKGSFFVRIKNFLKKFFPVGEKLGKRYDYARKCPLLLPVAWIHRFIKVLFVDKYSAKRSISDMKVATEKAEKQNEILDYFEIKL